MYLIGLAKLISKDLSPLPETSGLVDAISAYYKEHNALYSALCELTYTCNLKCFHCYNTHQKQIEFSLDQWKTTLDQLAELGCIHLTFSGGEPLLRKDLEQILEYARQKHFAINLFTNATCIDQQFANLLSKLGILEISTSLFSATPAIHDAITQKSGSWEKTICGIKLLVEKGFRVRVKCVIMKRNYDSYRDLLDLCENLGADCQFDTTLMPAGGNNLTVLSERLDDTQLRQVLSDPDVMYISGNPLEYDGGHQSSLQNDEHQLLCGAGVSYISINPYGEVYTCVQQQSPIGSLHKQSLKEIWEGSAELEAIRHRTTSDLHTCTSCQHNSYCGRCPALAEKEDGDALGPSSLACQTSSALRWVIENKGNL